MNGSSPLLVVTPTLGRSPWLYRTVLSVAAHAGPQTSHVLVAPPDTLKALGRKFPHCTLVADSVARGVYPAINLGLANAPDPRWKWFTWINDDDELMPGFARHLARTMRHDGDSLKAPWTFGQVQLSNGEADNLGRLAVSRWPSDILPLAQAGVNPFNQQGMLAPRAWVNRCGPLREDLRICADVDFWLKAVVAGAKFRCSSETVALFRLHAGQISGNVASHRSEFREVVQTVAGTSRGRVVRWIARARFRLGNAAVYADRIHRCGWKSGFEILEQPVRKPS